jgi:hypothetical protein
MCDPKTCFTCHKNLIYQIRYLASLFNPKQLAVDHILPGIFSPIIEQPFRLETVEDFLSLGLKGVENLLGHADGNLVQTLDKTPVRLVREFVERHAHQTSVLDVGLMLFVVELGLHGRREDLNHLDLGPLQLSPETENEVVQCRLGGAVVRAHGQGDEGEGGAGVDEGGFRVLGLEEG